MTFQFPPRSWPYSDPAPNIPPLAEIQFAEAPRHQLELRLLATTDVRAPGFVAGDDCGVSLVTKVRGRCAPTRH